MKKIIIAITCLFVLSNVKAAKEQDLKEFEATGNCVMGDLSNADLRNITAKLSSQGKKINLERANLSGANLKGVSLYDANLTQTNFTEAQLIGASMWYCNAQGANFFMANLFKSKLVSNNFAYADFRSAILTSSQIYGKQNFEHSISNMLTQYDNVTLLKLTWYESIRDKIRNNLSSK